MAEGDTESVEPKEYDDYRTTDVLVVGSGIAGLAAALGAAREGADVTVATKATRPEGASSWWAQGGIAVSRDDPDQFKRDILAASADTADPGETWAIGTEIHLTNHLQRWHPEVEVLPLCGDACMDCNAMRQVDPNYLTWVLEELADGVERNVVEVDPREKELAGLALERMLEV